MLLIITHLSVAIIYTFETTPTKMEHKQRILQLHSTGQFQCDYSFHLSLLKLVKQLNLYEWQERLQSESQLVHKIMELTEISSKHSQEDYDDAELVSLTHQIKNLIKKLNPREIHCFLKECDDLKWESYTAKATRLLDGKKDYESIVERIQSTVHSDQLRVDSLLFTALFSCINGQQVNNYIVIYSTMVDVFLKYLSGSAKQIEEIYEASTYSNICQMPRVKSYVITLYLILKVCLRFCEIIKVLAGKNNLSLKFTPIRKDIEKITKKYPELTACDDKEDILAIVPLFKELLKSKPTFEKSKICRWCFKLLHNERHEHAFCKFIITNRAKFIIEDHPYEE